MVADSVVILVYEPLVAMITQDPDHAANPRVETSMVASHVWSAQARRLLISQCFLGEEDQSISNEAEQLTHRKSDLQKGISTQTYVGDFNIPGEAAVILR